MRHVPGIWENEPPEWRFEADGLHVRTGRETDFWNKTFYGFRHTNGHFFAHPVDGDFSLELSFTARYRHLYDQAGAMLRVDENNWLKCGVEYTDGARHFSVVVTRDDQSDWSVLRLEEQEGPVTLRLTRHGEALRVQLRSDRGWDLVRLAFLAMPETVSVGPMCCSPTGEGLEVSFAHLELGPAIPRELHAAP